VGDEGGDVAARTGQDADDDPDDGGSGPWLPEPSNSAVAEFGTRELEGGGAHPLADAVLRHDQDARHRVQADQDDDDVEAAGKLENPERVALVAGDEIRAESADEQAERGTEHA